MPRLQLLVCSWLRLSVTRHAATYADFPVLVARYFSLAAGTSIVNEETEVGGGSAATGPAFFRPVCLQHGRHHMGTGGDRGFRDRMRPVWRSIRS